MKSELSSQYRFSDQLMRFTVVDLKLDQVTVLLERNLSRYGPVALRSLCGIQEIAEFLCPLKSFTTRFVAMNAGSWTYLVTDMAGENCYVDGYALSRLSGCKTFGITSSPQQREMHVYENGKPLRSIDSQADGDRWYFLQTGEQQPFEIAGDSKRTPRRERLAMETLKQYFESYTGMDFPQWKEFGTNEAVGFERSLYDLRQEVMIFNTTLGFVRLS